MTKEGRSYLLLKGLPKIILIQRTVLYSVFESFEDNAAQE